MRRPERWCSSVILSHLKLQPPWFGELPHHLSQSFSGPVLSSRMLDLSFSCPYSPTQRPPHLCPRSCGQKSLATCTMVKITWILLQISFVGQENTDMTYYWSAEHSRCVPAISCVLVDGDILMVFLYCLGSAEHRPSCLLLSRMATIAFAIGEIHNEASRCRQTVGLTSEDSVFCSRAVGPTPGPVRLELWVRQPDR